MTPAEPGPDTNKTAPRTRYTSRIAYSSWAPGPEKLAREIYGKFGHHKNLTLHTYDNHDATGYPGDLAKGDSSAVDFYVTGYNQTPTKAQLALGQEITDYATKNWRRLGVQYIIWNCWQNAFNNKGWTRYDPSQYKKWGDANWPTKIHSNHPHIRVRRR